MVKTGSMGSGHHYRLAIVIQLPFFMVAGTSPDMGQYASNHIKSNP